MYWRYCQSWIRYSDSAVCLGKHPHKLQTHCSESRGLLFLCLRRASTHLPIFPPTTLFVSLFLISLNNPPAWFVRYPHPHPHSHSYPRLSTFTSTHPSISQFSLYPLPQSPYSLHITLSLFFLVDALVPIFSIFISLSINIEPFFARSLLTPPPLPESRCPFSL